MGVVGGDTDAIQPDGNLISSILVRARKEPEVKLIRLVCLVADGQQTGVALANVEVDLGDGSRRTVNHVFYPSQRQILALLLCTRRCMVGATYSQSSHSAQ